MLLSVVGRAAALPSPLVPPALTVYGVYHRSDSNTYKLGFQNCECRFLEELPKTGDKRDFCMNIKGLKWYILKILWTQNQRFSKPVGVAALKLIRSLLLKSIYFWFSTFNLVFLTSSPKCSANPITVIPIWKRFFANGELPIRGLYRVFFEKFVFKFPFSHKRFQMGQKMYFYQFYKL